MGLRIDRLGDLDSGDVAQQDELLAEMLQEAAPVIDAKRGVVRDILVQPAAMFSAKVIEEQARLRRSSSLREILADPTLADDATVDNIASNYRVARGAGGRSLGAVTVVMDTNHDVSIPAGARFVSQGRAFEATAVFTGRGSADNVVADTDRLMTRQADGNYAFQITVVAVLVGEAGQLPKGAVLLPETPPLGFVSAEAAEDFIGGLSPDDNAALVAKFADGAAAKALSSRANMSAALHQRLATVAADSIIGMGDAEMLRDKHGVFQVATGGRVDWYVRTHDIYRSYGALRTATLIEKLDNGTSVWQMSFPRDVFPGFYNLDVRPANDLNFAGSFEITEEVRGFNPAPLSATDEFTPDIATAAEAAYTVYQTATVRFLDTVSDVTALDVGATADYDVTVRAMPDLLDLQHYFSGRSVRNAAGDLLIKAPVPCFLALSFVIELPPGADQPVVSDIADALSLLVNRYGFTGRLPASVLHDEIHNSLPPRSAIISTDVSAVIRRPDSTLKRLRSEVLIVVPTEPGQMVGPRTVAFFLDPADVAISYVTADIPEI